MTLEMVSFFGPRCQLRSAYFRVCRDSAAGPRESPKLSTRAVGERREGVGLLACPPQLPCVGKFGLEGTLGNPLALHFQGNLERSPALDEPDEQDHDCNDQEQVDVATECIGTDHT